ncbi:MAG: hypothetical protein A2X45_24955 [Lentisphaerae bacterium GWF2_50_93]|nr:MAG: hypothetical protein A2X45_24955 [Lentisphaerae bacterium GWF2_50_93]
MIDLGKNSTVEASELRKRSEELTRKKNGKSLDKSETMTQEEMRMILHELHVHQMELEMQNEELRTLQLKLEDARSRYFDLYDLAPVGYFTISGKGLILEANFTAVMLLGALSRSELVKHPFTQFIHKKDQDIFHLYSRKIHESGAPVPCELRMLKKDDTTFWAHLEATMAQDSEGMLVQNILISDITERKLAQEVLKRDEETLKKLVDEQARKLQAQQTELERTKRLSDIGVLASTVAHELRNPLAAIGITARIIGRNAKGTGLGLTVCRQIIDFHKGSISIESKYGNGTAVTLSLPRNDARNQPEETSGD